MKTKNVLLIAVLITIMLAVPSLAVTLEDLPESFTFRGYDWGTPVEEIKGKEITPDMVFYNDYFHDEDSHIFVVKAKVSTLNALANFCCDEDDMLQYGVYKLNEVHSYPIEYYNDYVTITELLTSKYGDPITQVNVGFENNEDISGLRPEEIINEITNNGAIAGNAWLAQDQSFIYCALGMSDGHCNTELYYFQSTEQADETLLNTNNTEGL